MSGGESGCVDLWDIRMNKDSLFKFSEEGDNVVRVEWNSNRSGVFASGGDDSKIRFWDCSKIN